MHLTRFAAGILSVAAMAGAATAVVGQNYPHKPIRIVTTEPGSGNDIVARIMAPGLTAALGQQFIVDNRGIGAGEIVTKTQADGYTLLSYGSPLWIATLLRNNVSYDPVRDFSPITLAEITPNIVVVNISLPVKSLTELIALAKSKPGELNYASSSTGATPHLAAELFKAMAGVNIVRIPYKGSGPALTALVGGQVQLMFPNVGAATPHLKSGRLRALAVASAQPSTLAPGLPTAAAAGLPGYESSSPFGIFAPARTPVKLVALLNQEMVRILNAPDVREKLFSSGVEVVASSPQELAAVIKAEMAKWGKVIKDAGIRDE